MSMLLAGCETDPGTDTTTQLSGGSDSDTGTDTGEPWEPIPARGDIELSHVVVNQAVDVPIAVAGVWVGPEDRNTFVVANRDTLLRGFWDIPEDWVDRNITGRLDLEFPDGTTATKQIDIFIDAPSYAGDLKRAFTFPLLAEEFPPGIKYQLSLWEAGPGFEEERESTTVTKSPLDGLEQIGVQSEPAELKVVLVPVRYEVPGCSTNTGEITDAEEKNFLDFLHEQYPVEQVIMDFRRDSPIEWNQTLTSLAQLWQPLRDLRDVDLAAPNVYYYALVDACTGGIDGAGGIAPGLATDTKSAAYERVSSGLWHRTGTYHYETMVHELGHNHGRAHIFCANGDAAGTDPSYPYTDGVIGVWGFGIRLFKLHSPTASWEFMTYCSPTWVSDWGWSKAYNRIRTLTSWDYEGAAPDQGATDDREVLIGLLFKNGTEEWSTTHGAREPEFFSSGEVVSFDYAGGEVVDSPTNVQILDDGTTMITTMVPRREATFERATRVDAGKPRPIVLQTPQTRAYKL